MPPPPVLVFVGAVYPGQFGLLCDHLRRTGQAETYFLTTPGHRDRNRDRGPHILAFQPDGNIMGVPAYYYSGKAERSARIGRGVLDAVTALERQRPIDAIIAHSLWGAPQFLYDETDAAIVSYVEFPSYRAHGWDPAYPPDRSQRLADRNMEMLHFHQVLKSDLTICPSAHARSMFPAELQGRIAVQFEGFDITPPPALPRPAEGPPTIGFAARDLSSAKGFDIFVRLVDRLLAEGVTARFVALGDAAAATYGYEAQWVERHHGGKVATFRDHLLLQHPRAAAAVEFPGKLPYDQFAERVAGIDLFLYPLRFGVANWGLMEILARGGCVLAPDRGYAAELIRSDENGLLLPDDDDAWIAAIRALLADPARRARYGAAARDTGRSYHIDRVAPRYMRLFRQAMAARDRRLGRSPVAAQ
ncbi:glycosyltransferase [Frigidibacter oleivorans]|uniref:glycosyltransferase n=1 Tax=Frigidibacter oleivorans TaxID=2487129 RepID=UPI000F8EFA76|nr:glycosyltransferase [Frigidibacter oleivorans]